MRTAFRPSDITFNISCDPSRVTRLRASLRLFTRTAPTIKLEVIDVVHFSFSTLVVCLVSFRSWSPVNLADLLTQLAALRQITNRPISDCTFTYH